MNDRIAYRMIVALVIAAWTTPLPAHPDDPKVRDRVPPYDGPGWTEGSGIAVGNLGFRDVGISLKAWITLS
ncbi:MAG: hypothetical protein V3T70_04675, partial [Phycisphaerae bacterium]